MGEGGNQPQAYVFKVKKLFDPMIHVEKGAIIKQ
jgi:hypothetical protein